MEILNTIGVDVSKDTLDAFNYCLGEHKQFNNRLAGIKKLVKWVVNIEGELGNVLFCFEHTGLYSIHLAEYLDDQKILFAMVPGLEIKRSLGIVRGKNDKIDSYQIAKYAFLRKDEIQPTILPTDSITKIKRLLSLREKLVRQRAQYKGTIKEFKNVLKTKGNEVLFKVHNQMIKALDKRIDEVEKELTAKVKSDPKIYATYELITSVKGVGFVLGLSFIAYTKCFTCFDNWRKFACYSGIAPFDHQSGKSISPKRINPMANKKIKSLLSNAATSSVRYNPEIKAYYQRRLEMGKNKMSTLNIIRNKIVSRVFAVVKRGTPYVDTMNYAT
jgi:transposase